MLAITAAVGPRTVSVTAGTPRRRETRRKGSGQQGSGFRCMPSVRTVWCRTYDGPCWLHQSRRRPTDVKSANEQLLIHRRSSRRAAQQLFVFTSSMLLLSIYTRIERNRGLPSAGCLCVNTAAAVASTRARTVQYIRP